MDEIQKNNIDGMVEHRQKESLLDLLCALYDLPQKTPVTIISRSEIRGAHEVLCELSNALVKNNAADLYLELVTASGERGLERVCDLNNLPTYNGAHLLDLANNNGAYALSDAIERQGGVKFPIALRSRLAEESFFEWNLAREKDCGHNFLAHLSASPEPANMTPHIQSNLMIAVAAYHILARDDARARRTIGLVNKSFVTHQDMKDLGILMGLSSKQDPPLPETAQAIRALVVSVRPGELYRPAPTQKLLTAPPNGNKLVAAFEAHLARGDGQIGLEIALKAPDIDFNTADMLVRSALGHSIDRRHRPLSYNFVAQLAADPRINPRVMEQMMRRAARENEYEIAGMIRDSLAKRYSQAAEQVHICDLPELPPGTPRNARFPEDADRPSPSSE